MPPALGLKSMVLHTMSYQSQKNFRIVFIGALESIFGCQGEYFLRENVIVDTTNVCQRAMGNNNLFSEVRVS